MELASSPNRFIFFGPQWNELGIFEVETQWSLKESDHLLKCLPLVH